jgi:hypothetical protein
MLRWLPWIVCGLAGVARADEPPAIETYALVVGSNAAGPGQTELRYAEDDARRVGAILTELGGYTPAAVEVVVHPTPAALREKLARLEQRVAAGAAAGKQARVFFYYSGHARASAIDLGPDGMPLAELRQRLFAIPATLTVVVLDACQSGAFSRVKGASPAADFSFNSRQTLDAKGIAVLASSTGSELSQESEHLRSSYFTHHLLVGMRGAGDANRDGQVSVDEAYRYAYHQTLLATAATAVGGQHVTLEVDLKGHGEVPLSFPRVATASIELPAALSGHALVSDKRAKAVVAETHKVKGTPTRIAVAPGEYEVLVREGDRIRRCPATAPGVVELDRCTVEAAASGTRKGRFSPAWRIAADVGAGFNGGDSPFKQTLRDFSFVEDGAGSGDTDGSTSFTASLAVTRERWPGIAFGGYLATNQPPGWTREVPERAPLQFEWRTTTVGAIAHAEHWVSPRFHLFTDGIVGLGIGRTTFVDQDDITTRETHFGPVMSVFAGAALRVAGGVSFGAGGGYTYAPINSNDIGQRHNEGGATMRWVLSYEYGGSR